MWSCSPASRGRLTFHATVAARSGSSGVPSCQVALYSEYGRPEVRFVRAGTLDDPSAIQPDVHIFTRSKLHWVTLPDTVPAYDVYYDFEDPVAGREPRAARRAQAVSSTQAEGR